MAPSEAFALRRLRARMTQAKPPAVVSRYDKDKIAAEVEHARVRLGWEIKDLSLEAGIGATWEKARDNWYKHTRGRKTPFTVDQLGKLAVILDAPPLWPFREWSTALQKRWPGNTPAMWEKRKPAR
jgi:hypothetical protein